MSEHPTGRVRPTPAQPKMAKLDSLPERVTYEEMRSQAMGPFHFKSPLAPTTQGVTPPMTPGGPRSCGRPTTAGRRRSSAMPTPWRPSAAAGL